MRGRARSRGMDAAGGGDETAIGASSASTPAIATKHPVARRPARGARALRHHAPMEREPYPPASAPPIPKRSRGAAPAPVARSGAGEVGVPALAERLQSLDEVVGRGRERLVRALEVEQVP